MYCALLADIVRSRKRRDAVGVQSALERAGRVLGERYQAEFAAGPTITSGDELQALLITPVHAFDLVFDLVDLLHPLLARFGVGLGELATELRPTTGSLSGPAFYRARDAAEAARGGGQHVVFSGFGDGTETLNVIANCAIAIAVQWTPSQRESVAAYLRHGSHRAAAAALGKERSSVTRSLQRALAAEVKTSRDHLRRLLGEITEADVATGGSQ